MPLDLMWQRKLTTQEKIHHCWSRLGHNPLFFFLFLNSFRHRNAANQAEFFGAAKRAEMAEIEQMKKIIPLIRVKLPLVGMSAIWCLSQCNGFGFWGQN